MNLLPFSIVVFLLLVTGLVLTVIEFSKLEKQEPEQNNKLEAEKAKKQSV
jgi:hypothetical protein